MGEEEAEPWQPSAAQEEAQLREGFRLDRIRGRAAPLGYAVGALLTLLFLILIICILSVVVGISNDIDKLPESEAPGRLSPYSKIAVVYGDDSWGRVFRTASELAADTADLEGLMVSFIEGKIDTPENYKNQIEGLYKQGYRTFLGLDTSALSVAVLNWAETENADAYFITPFASSSELRQYKRCIQMYMDNLAYAEAVAVMMYNMKPTKLYVIQRDDEYGRDVTAQLKRATITVEGHYEYVSATLDVAQATTVLQQVASAVQGQEEETAIFLVTFDEGLYFMEALSSVPSLQGFIWMAADSVTLSNKVIDSDTARTNAEAIGLFGAHYMGWRGSAVTTSRRKFVSDMNAKGAHPEGADSSIDLEVFLDFLGYDSMLAALTIARNPPLVIEALQGVNGLSGPLDMDSDYVRATGDYAIYAVVPRGNDLASGVYTMRDGNWMKRDLIQLAPYFSDIPEPVYVSNPMEAHTPIYTARDLYPFPVGISVNKDQFVPSPCTHLLVKAQTFCPVSFSMFSQEWDESRLPATLFIPSRNPVLIEVNCDELPDGPIYVTCQDANQGDSTAVCVGAQ